MVILQAYYCYFVLTIEFLIFQIERNEQGVEVYYKDENLWATQKAISTLFD